jgi:hypothetical protein
MKTKNKQVMIRNKSPCCLYEWRACLFIARQLTIQTYENPCKPYFLTNYVSIMTHKIKVTYMLVSDIELPVTALRIADSLNGNQLFPNPPHTPAEIRTKIVEYTDALSLAKLGDERAISVKNTKRNELRLMLHKVAGYVSSVGNNDLNVLQTSGFDITGPKPRTVNSTFEVTTGIKPGQVTTAMKAVRGARMYFHQYTPDPFTDDSVWTEVATTSRTYDHTGLIPRQSYWFRVKAVTQQNEEIYTDLKKKIVQ